MKDIGLALTQGRWAELARQYPDRFLRVGGLFVPVIAGGVDNITLNAGSGGATLATEDVGTVHHQKVKVEFGADGVATLVDGTTGLPTDPLDRALRDMGKIDVAGLDQYTPLDLDDGGGTLNALPVSSPNRIASGALGALNAAVTLTAQGAGSVAWEIDTGTLVGTVVFEATLDDATWFAVNAIRIDGTIVASTATFADRGALSSVGYSQVRLRVSAFTSGTSNARMEGLGGAAGVVRLGQALPPGTNNIGDVDVLTVPAPLSTQGGGTEATALRVTLANDSTGLVSVDDNAGSLTVDAPVATPVAVRVSDGVAFIAPAKEGQLPAALVGGRLDVNVGAALPPGTNNIGDIDVLTLPGSLAGKAEDSVAVDLDVGLPILGVRNDAAAAKTSLDGDYGMLALDSAGRVGIADLGGSLTVDAPVATPVAVRLSDGAAFFDPRLVEGKAAHDAVISGNPVQLGARANLNEPAVVADGDVTHLWADLLGRLVVLPGHPNPEVPVTANGSAAGLSVIAAPGASLSLYICKVTVMNRAAAETVISLREGAAGSIRTTLNAAADGGGANLDYGARGWKLPANTALVADIGAASADINVTEYYIAA